MRMLCGVIMLFGVFYACTAQTSAINYRVFEVKIKKEILKNEAMGSKVFRLPQFRVYNRKGQQVAELGSGVSEDFKQKLETALKLSSPTNSERTLNWEMERITDMTGKSLPDADFTVVQYWAEWCKPCEAQSKLMTEVLNSHPELHVNILHVEADPVKTFPDIFRMRGPGV